MTRQCDDDERLACAALTYLAEPSDLWLGKAVMSSGAAGTLDAIKAGRYAEKAAGSEAAKAAAGRAMARWQVRLGEVPDADDLAKFRSQGIRLICPGDPEWPSQLDDLGAGAPYALWVRGNGDLRFGCLRSVAVVGSRAATAYGSYVAAEIAASVAARGWTIVSGAAYGVDAAAHRGALGAGGVTVAVLACGVDRPYPAGHKDLLDTIADTGVVVSEWPPGRNATRLRFLVRNRVIAALSAATLVVEAGERSGALNTARHARDMDRRLMAVPGPITSQQSAGCHTIIREWRGTLVTGAADVLEMVAPLGSGPDGSGPDGGGPDGGLPVAGRAKPVLARDALDLESATVLDALPTRGGIGTTAVATRAGLDPVTVVRCLGDLAASGFAERCEGGWRIRRS
ncbi:MAG TPA: DNA-processing protein DprA [Trebonia sp.]|jgi:DNA processing protein|nr:DNA-processing protein DprA [Trebonia sp.]